MICLVKQATMHMERLRPRPGVAPEIRPELIISHDSATASATTVTASIHKTKLIQTGLKGDESVSGRWVSALAVADAATTVESLALNLKLRPSGRILRQSWVTPRLVGNFSKLTKELDLPVWLREYGPTETVYEFVGVFTAAAAGNTVEGRVYLEILRPSESASERDIFR